MLKFSGYPYLIRGQPLKIGGLAAEGLAGLMNVIEVILLRPKPMRLRRRFRGTPSREGGTRAQYQAVLDWCNDARTGMPLGIPRGAMCVQRFDDSLNSAIHITYRISLRSSSMPEPRDPLLKVLIDLSIYSDDTVKTRVWFDSGGRSSGRRPAAGATLFEGVTSGCPAKATRVFQLQRVGGRARRP
jgi:hypothetical protein